MILAIDCGNTNVSFALYNDAGKKQGNWRLETRAQRPADDYAVALSRLLEADGFSLDAVSLCALACVVPEATPHLTGFCVRRIGVTPVIADPAKGDLGLQVLIDTPAQLGADRLVNAFSVACSGQLPAIVLDFGTATTFDVILPSRDGTSLACYDGGIIAPGVHRSLEALVAAAARLPAVTIEAWPAEQPVIGKSTETAMQSGVLWGYASLIEGMLSRIEAHYQMQMQVVATGGLAYLFAPHISKIEHIRPDLTTDGLYQMAVRAQ